MKTNYPIILACILLFFISKMQAQEITIFPGFWAPKYYQDNNEISKKDVISLIKTDQEAYSYWKKSNTYNTLSWISLAVEAGFSAWTVERAVNDGSTLGPLLATTGSFVGVIVFGIISGKKKKQAILKYNTNFDSKTTFKVEPSKTGFGIALNF